MFTFNYSNFIIGKQLKIKSFPDISTYIEKVRVLLMANYWTEKILPLFLLKIFEYILTSETLL